MVNYGWNKVMGLYRKDGEFFRKGKIGDWLQYFSRTQSKEYDSIVKENLSYEMKLDYGVSDEDLIKIYDASKDVKD